MSEQYFPDGIKSHTTTIKSSSIIDSSGSISFGSNNIVTSGTINTGKGDNELYCMNQNVRTIDSVAFSDLTIGTDDVTPGFLTMLGSGSMILYDYGNNTTVTIGPVRDGETILDITGSINISSNITAATYGTDGTITNEKLQVLDEGDSDQVLVGAGVGTKPVWTDISGSGAIAGTISPVFTTPYIGEATAESIISTDYISAGTLTIDSGSITDTSGAISFGDENLTTTGIGNFAGITLNSIASFTAASNTDIDTGTETVDSFSDILGDGCVWYYVVKNGANLRTGTVMAAWDASGDTVAYSEMSSGDVGDTSGVTFSVDISSNSVRLRATAGSNNWSVKVTRILM